MAFLIPDRITTLNGVTTKIFDLTKHNDNNISLPAKQAGAVEGVTIHNTDIINAAKGTTMAEQYTRATYNGRMNDVRVHFYVDDVEAWRGLPLDLQNWTCGSKYKKNGALFPEPEANGSQRGNKQTIAIECIMGGERGYEKAEDNAARLAAYLLYTNGLGVDKLYTHNYWVNLRRGVIGDVDMMNTTYDRYKGCPIYIRPHWAEFKQTVQGYITALGKSDKPPEDGAQSFKVRVLDPSLNIRKSAGTASSIVGKITDKGVYTIVETCYIGKVQWGKLKSGAGWISLKDGYVVKI